MSLALCNSIQNSYSDKIAQWYWRNHYDGQLTIPVVITLICALFFHRDDTWMDKSVCYDWMYENNQRGVIRNAMLSGNKRRIFGKEIVSPSKETNQCTRWRVRIGNIAKTRESLKVKKSKYLRRFVCGISERQPIPQLRFARSRRTHRYYGINQSGVKTIKDSRGVLTHESIHHLVPSHIEVDDILTFELIVLDDVVELKIAKDGILLFSINNLSKESEFSLFAALAYPWQTIEILSFEQYYYESRPLIDYDFDQLFSD